MASTCISKKKRYYHATDYKNVNSIFIEGIKPGVDGITYLCEDPRHAANFVALRGIFKIAIFELELDESEVEETFDHNARFFKCKAYGYKHVYPVDENTKVLVCQVKEETDFKKVQHENY